MEGDSTTQRPTAQFRRARGERGVSSDDSLMQGKNEPFSIIFPYTSIPAVTVNGNVTATEAGTQLTITTKSTVLCRVLFAAILSFAFVSFFIAPFSGSQPTVPVFERVMTGAMVGAFFVGIAVLFGYAYARSEALRFRTALEERFKQVVRVSSGVPISFHCTHCGAPLTALASQRGRVIQCTSCKKATKVTDLPAQPPTPHFE